MSDQDDCVAIVRAVVGLGRSLGMAVNAEGVETEEQLVALRAEGCGEVQGYLFSKARPATEIPDLLARQHDAPNAGPREQDEQLGVPVADALQAA
jgi:EAL domain-containing protein (putative c-di-GMP-specific phosphodiesterase class I)